MTFLKKSHDGEIFLDHRASPGIPAGLARRLGYDPSQVKEGALFEGPTLGCPHCGSCVVLNPLRTRERAHCLSCNMYICDGCDYVRNQPDYVHRTIAQIKELVGSGKYELAGTMQQPLLIPKEG